MDVLYFLRIKVTSEHWTLDMVNEVYIISSFYRLVYLNTSYFGACSFIWKSCICHLRCCLHCKYFVSCKNLPFTCSNGIRLRRQDIRVVTIRTARLITEWVCSCMHSMSTQNAGIPHRSIVTYISISFKWLLQQWNSVVSYFCKNIYVVHK